MRTAELSRIADLLGQVARQESAVLQRLLQERAICVAAIADADTRRQVQIQGDGGDGGGDGGIAAAAAWTRSADTVTDVLAARARALSTDIATQRGKCRAALARSRAARDVVERQQRHAAWAAQRAEDRAGPPPQPRLPFG